ncbi:MAG: hypothetical protein GXP08_09850 [Gammaproteobacteria bacterium]|nr:hypothetical protein [Gammaproteobacteria bacterium]
MKKDIYLVLIAQFLTAFADNASLFTAITLVFQLGEPVSRYMLVLQASFLVVYVAIVPWLGPKYQSLWVYHQSIG